jgi:hypothetical protein
MASVAPDGTRLGTAEDPTRPGQRLVGRGHGLGFTLLTAMGFARP